jgi:hypothetical protein
MILLQKRCKVAAYNIDAPDSLRKVTAGLSGDKHLA